MFKKIKAITTAFKAGWIASSCPDCVMDDETEIIFACDKHEEEIARLAKINQDNW